MNIEQMKEIVNNAPNGSDVYDTRFECYVSDAPKRETLNLSDLRTIIAQHEEIERLKQERDSVCYLNDELSAALTREQSK